MTSDPTPEPLDRTRLADGLEATGMRVELLDTAPSTNLLLAERARADEPAGLVLVAERQTAGRGRLDRSWVAPPGAALTFSMLVRPDVPAAGWPWLPLVAGLAVVRALGEAWGDPGLKWPNDVLLGGRKVAGILVERVESASGPAAVIGVGLNTGLTEEQLPVPGATSLYLEAGQWPDRTAVLLDLLRELHRVFEGFRGASPELAADYRRACVTLGRRVRVQLPDGSDLQGEARAVDEYGRLVVATPTGESAVGAGDVVHVRASP